MRGSKPKALTILPADRCELERIAHSDTLPWYQVRRARMVLAIAAGQGREALAIQLECDESTIWRTCQRYRQLGLRRAWTADELWADELSGRLGTK